MIKALIVSFILTLPGFWVKAQADDIEQLILDYEKLEQLKNILNEMYKGYQILSNGYETVRSIAEGNYNLHEIFLDGLYLVNPAVRNYKRIPLIINYQVFLTNEYKRAYNKFKSDPNLNAHEINYLESVYSYLISQSLRNIEELTMIITASKLRMSDDERLRAIDRIYYDMGGKVSFIRYFNNSTQLLLMQRSRKMSEVISIQRLYNINP